MRLLWIGVLLLFATAIAKQTLNVLVISDFSLAFVPSSSIDRSILASGPYICPPSAYPTALSQFQFTSDVIAGVNKTIPMSIQYYVYSGGDGDPIGKTFSNRDNFTETSIPAYTKFCAEGPAENDFVRFMKLTITPAINTDLLILFTAAPQSQVNKVLPIVSNNVKRVIVLGLNATSASNAYPKSAVRLSDFSQPDRVSCMVNELYETIYGKIYDVDAVAVCYPPEATTKVVETTAVPTTVPETTILPTTTTTPPPSPLRILFVNDFTSDYMIEDMESIRALRPSNAIKCPANAHPEAAAEFDFTNAIVQGISDDIPMEIYYFAYTGEDWHQINAEAMDKEQFSKGMEFKNDVCFEDEPLTSDLNILTSTIENFENVVDVDIIVMLLAASQSAFDNAFPLAFGDATVITVGLKGGSAFNAYPTTATIIDDFSQPEVITCMIEAAFRGETNPVELCGAQKQRPPMTILFVNDFTSDFVGDDDVMVKKVPTSKATTGKCPGRMYPQAGQEFNFTVDIVNGIRADANIQLTFSENIGESYNYFLPIYSRDDFKEGANAMFKDACFEDHHPTDFDSLEIQLRFVPTNVLVLFSAVSLERPLNLPNIDRVIAVGLNGADQSRAYPKSSISIADFSRPEVISCMINRLWGNMSDDSLIICAN